MSNRVLHANSMMGMLFRIADGPTHGHYCKLYLTLDLLVYQYNYSAEIPYLTPEFIPYKVGALSAPDNNLLSENVL